MCQQIGGVIQSHVITLLVILKKNLKMACNTNQVDLYSNLTVEQTKMQDDEILQSGPGIFGINF